MSKLLTGGCQCGHVRFAIEGPLGRASLCHCRMCQKALGSFFGPFVTAPGLRWTRGEPRYFASSNLARRGFCADCGTPLSFEPTGGPVDVAIGALDTPAIAPPTVQLHRESALPWLGDLAGLPDAAPGADAAVISRQHPDRETPAAL